MQARQPKLHVVAQALLRMRHLSISSLVKAANTHTGGTSASRWSFGLLSIKIFCA